MAVDFGINSTILESVVGIKIVLWRLIKLVTVSVALGGILVAAMVLPTRPNPDVDYKTGNLPIDIVYNYLVAANRRDISVMYGYLQMEKAANIQRDIAERHWEIRDSYKPYPLQYFAIHGLQTIYDRYYITIFGSSHNKANAFVFVKIYREYFRARDRLQEESFFVYTLMIEDGQWRIVESTKIKKIEDLIPLAR